MCREEFSPNELQYSRSGILCVLPSDWPLSNDIITYRAGLITLHLVVSIIDYLYFEIQE
jgi:hypothetical protein